jgi:hypothetical protein
MEIEFTLYGVSVFGAEVDDRGLDFVARAEGGRHLDVHVHDVVEDSDWSLDGLRGEA